MKKILVSVLGVAILVLIGCGGGTKDTPQDTSKEAANYYKEEFRKATSLKALNTDKRVLFTMKSLRDNFLQSFDVNGSNEGINRDIIELFKSNIEKSIDVVENFTIKEDTPIFMASMQVTEQPEKHLDAKLKSAIKTVCTECKEADIEDWFSHNQASLEKSMEDNNDVDIENDKDPYLVQDPPPTVLLLIPWPKDKKEEPIHYEVGPNDDTSDFIEMQTERAEFARFIDARLP